MIVIENELVRYAVAVLIAFAIAVIVGPLIIPALRKLKFGQSVREDGPQTHLVKQGTPTMGGVIMLIAMMGPFVLLDYKNSLMCVFAAATTFGFGLIGFLDDFIKVHKKRSLGLRAYQKIIGQLGLSIVIALFVQNRVGTSILIPFTGYEWDLGAFYLPFAVFVVVAVVNSVNLTDGLDGLAAGVTMICMATFTALGYLVGTTLGLTGDTFLFSASVTGATLGFLVFNTYPAKVFMGDTGSLALGGALSAVALITRLPLIFPIMGITFVASAASVSIQVISFKLFKKRVFRMAPLHHHFEMKGIAETKIVSMYMLVTVLACLVAIIAYI